jgi:hypothetical protein
LNDQLLKCAFEERNKFNEFIEMYLKWINISYLRAANC